MPLYKDLRRYANDPYDPDKQNWIAQRLLTLRHDVCRDITAGRGTDTMILGSWNIRGFDDGASRLDESMHYIAEIIAAFDICAIQEVRDDLRPLERLVRLLGPDWDYFVSDVSTHEGGNRERMAFVYNTGKVFFRKVIGEIVLRADALVTGRQPARSPFFAAFQAGWFRFTICSAHIVEGITGQTSAQNRASRADEIRAITHELLLRARDEDEVFFFVGDMNIEKADDEIIAALKEAKADGRRMEVPDFGPTNLTGKKYFDHIAFSVEGAATRKTELVRAGAFDWRNAVYGPAQTPHSDPDPPGLSRVDDDTNIARYIAQIQGHRTRQGYTPMKRFREQYQSKTTYEMSDHLPIWVEVKTDYSNDYLGQFVTGP